MKDTDLHRKESFRSFLVCMCRNYNGENHSNNRFLGEVEGVQSSLKEHGWETLGHKTFVQMLMGRFWRDRTQTPCCGCGLHVSLVYGFLRSGRFLCLTYLNMHYVVDIFGYGHPHYVQSGKHLPTQAAFVWAVTCAPKLKPIPLVKQDSCLLQILKGSVTTLS